MKGFLQIDTIAILRQQAERMRANGYKFPEIKGVNLKRSNPKPLRNAVSRVVMVGFDPYNQSGLPEHIERQVVHDYWARLENEFIYEWVNDAPAGEVRFGALLVPVEGLTVVPPDQDIPMMYAPGSMDRLRHFEDGAMEYAIKKTSMTPEQQAELEAQWNELSPVFKDGKILAAMPSLEELRAKALTGECDPYPGVLFASNQCPETVLPILVRTKIRLLTGYEGSLLTMPPPEVLEEYKAMKKLDWDENEFECSPHVSSHGDGYKLDHVAALPPATGAKPAMREGYDRLADERGHNETLGLFTRTRPNPLREHWEKHGDPYEGRLPQGTVSTETIVELLDLHTNPELQAKVMLKINPEASGEPEVLTPEDIADREQAIQEAAEGKLDYLLEGTQWDPRNRK